MNIPDKTIIVLGPKWPAMREYVVRLAAENKLIKNDNPWQRFLKDYAQGWIYLQKNVRLLHSSNHWSDEKDGNKYVFFFENENNRPNDLERLFNLINLNPRPPLIFKLKSSSDSIDSQINVDGSLQIGCQTISAEEFERVVKLRKEYLELK